MATFTGKKRFKATQPTDSSKWVRVGFASATATANADRKKFNKGLEKI